MNTSVAVAASPAGQPADATDSRAALRSWWGLLVLVLIGFYVVLDRQVFTLQIEPIRRQLQLNDFQIGLVQGLSVAVFAAIVGYPIGWLADRYDRRAVLIGCIAVWSVAVVGCGLSHGFGELFLASALVGAGESGVLPIAYALIPEWFRGRQRALANSMFMVVGRLGVGLVIAACGYLVANVDAARPWLPAAMQGMETWRLAFIASALPGLPIALLILSIPMRRKGSARPAGPRLPSAPVLPFLRAQIGTFGTFYVGVGLLVFGFSAIGAFLPVVAMRQMGATPVQVGNAMGTATFVATCVGLVFANYGMRLLGQRSGARLPIVMLMLTAFLGGLSVLLLLLARTPNELFAGLGLNLTFVMAGSMLFPTALQELTPTVLRARLVSIIIMVNTVFSALSPPIVGALSDALKPRPDGLLLAAVGTSAVALFIGSAVLWFCARRYEATTAAARAVDGEASASAATP